MPVIDIQKDLENRTITVTADFAAPVERVWQVYADPRQMAQIWAPEGLTTTIVEHTLAPGGRVTYFMVGPEGEKYPGYWEVDAVDEPSSFTFRDGFADEDLKPVPDLPVSSNEYRFEPTETGTRATYTSTYASAEALQQVLDMGVEQGLTSAINQIDGLLAS